MLKRGMTTNNQKGEEPQLEKFRGSLNGIKACNARRR